VCVCVCVCGSAGGGETGAGQQEGSGRRLTDKGGDNVNKMDVGQGLHEATENIKKNRPSPKVTMADKGDGSILDPPSEL